MAQQFRLFMISAMYENGGNTTHRLLDGHPELYVYPFESQVGTNQVTDYLASYVPFKYRWPEFSLSGTVEQDYELIFDEEMKVLLRTPDRSKFKNCGLKIDEKYRIKQFVKHVQGKPRTRAHLVEAFFRSTFDTWTNYNRSGKEHTYVGYNPVQVFDTEKILSDFPDGHVIHVVRNPYSGYADTKKRPYPLPLARYVWTWNLCQHMALTYAGKYPKHFHIVRFEDIVADMKGTLGKLCGELGIGWSDTCLKPTWNGTEMKQVYPWGTIRVPTPEANVATMNELSDAEKAEVTRQSIVMQKILGYEKFAASAGRQLSKPALAA
jgi:hypothetical protein